MTILFTPRAEKGDPIVAPDNAGILRDGWRDDLTDDEIIALQCDYLQAILPDPETVLWTIDNLHHAARAAYAHGLSERIPALMNSRNSAFGRI